MSTVRLEASIDTTALASAPDLAHNTLGYLVVEKDAAIGYLMHPTSGKAPTSTLGGATLRLYSTGSAVGVTATLVVTLIADFWGASDVTWNNRPTVTGAATTVTATPTGDGFEWVVPITTQLAAAYAAGQWAGVELTRSDNGAPIEFYTSESGQYAPTLELDWIGAATPPTRLTPTGGSAVGTPLPPLKVDVGIDCDLVQVLIWTGATNDGEPDFDTDPVPSVDGFLYLADTLYDGIPEGADGITWQGQWRNSSGVWSGYGPTTARTTYRPPATVTLLSPDPAGGGVIPTDTPLFEWEAPAQVQYQLTLSPADDPSKAAFDSKRKPASSDTGAVQVTQGAIRDSSIMTYRLIVKDGYDRVAVPGFPAETVVEGEVTFQGVRALPSPELVAIRPFRTGSPFPEYIWRWTHGDLPDSWQAHRDSEIIMGAKESPQVWRDADGLFHWVDFEAPPNRPHHVRLEQKTGNQVSHGSNAMDFIIFAVGKWLGSPKYQFAILLWGNAEDDLDMGEVGSIYYPLRGENATYVQQNIRGYEGPISGYLRDFDPEYSVRQQYLDLMTMKADVREKYVVAYPNLSFKATLFKIVAKTRDSVKQKWNVTLNTLQQGPLTWLAREPIPPESRLLWFADYEEGTNNTALTTVTHPLALEVGGTPVYKQQAKAQGEMGWRSPNTLGGGWITYPVTYFGMADIYFTPRASSDKGTIARLQPDIGAGFCCYVNLRAQGDLGVSDQDDHNVDGGQSHGLYGWAIDKQSRITFSWYWNTGRIWMQFRYYATSQSVNPSDSWECDFPCTLAPGRLYVGNGNQTKTTDIDCVSAYAGTATWPPPLAPGQAEVLHAIPGDVTTTGAVVKSRVLNVDTIDLAVSTSVDSNGNPVSPTYYQPANDLGVSPEGFVEHHPNDGAPDTTYYAKHATAPGEFVGDLIEWKNAPAFGVGFTRKIALVSCQRNETGSQTGIGWSDVLAWGPHELMMNGDGHYLGGQYDPSTPWTTMADGWTQQLIGIPAMRQAFARAGTTVFEDDHGFSADNGESNDDTATGKVRATNIYMQQQVFPLYPLADDREPDEKRNLSGSRMLGKNVRIIFLDGEGLDRSLSDATDNEAKTFVGSEVDEWFRGELRKPAAVNIIITAKGLLGDEQHTKASADKPSNYSAWTRSLATFLNEEQTLDGKPIYVYWMGGDRHANYYASKTDNPILPGHPTACSSGIEMFALDEQPGEDDATASFGFNDHTLDVPVVQWMPVTITDAPSGAGAGTITVTIKSRQSENTWSGGHQTAPGSWSLVDGFTYTDTWSYTASPGALLATWAADAEQTTCEITAVTAGATSVGLRVSQHADMSDATSYTAGAPDASGWRKWHITGLPVGSRFYYQFTDTFTGHFTDIPISDVYSAETLKAAGRTNYTTRIAAGSCGQTAPMSPAAFNDIVAWAPNRMIHLGDLGYPGNLNTNQATHKQNWSQEIQDTGLQRAMQQMCMDYVISDHDSNGYRHQSNWPSYHDATTQTNVDAWVDVIPARVEDPRTPIRGRWRSEVEGHVRYVKVDTRTWDRSDVRENGVHPTDSGSTMLGAEQLAWLEGEIRAAATAGQVIMLYTDPAWNGTSPYVEGTGIPATYSDKWPSYIVERDHISDYAFERGVDLFIVYGDSHGLQQDDGTHEKNGNASICCGPFDQHLHMHFQDSVQFNYPEGLEEGDKGKTGRAQQYQRLTVEETPGVVKITADAMDCTPGVGSSVPIRTMVKSYAVSGGDGGGGGGGDYVPPAGSITPSVVDGQAFRRDQGSNTHWNFPGPYQHADAFTVLAALNPGWFRQRLFHDNTRFKAAVDALAPGTKFLGAAGQLSDSEAAVRAEIAAWRDDPRSANLIAILGPNEPNGTDTGFAAGAANNTIRHMYWIWDEVMNGGTWTHRAGDEPPLIIGPALKRAGFAGDDEQVYDDSITALAAASYTTGGHTYKLGELCDGLDHHHYDGVNGPGFRVNGLDSYGDKPPGLTLGSDGKCTKALFELKRAGRMAPGVPVKYWTEGGWTDAEDDPTQAQRALFAVESYLRAWRAGVGFAEYELYDEYDLYEGGREDYFGIYRLTTNPHGAAGPKQIYTALQTLFGYTGTASFSGVGWVEPLAGNNPDCGVVVFSKAGGGWDMYLLAEARGSVDVVVAAGRSITGQAVTSTDSSGNKHHTVTFGSATMVKLAIA